MIDKSPIFETKIEQNAEGLCYDIFNLAKVGIAANDTSMAIDLNKGGYDTLLELIAVLAMQAAESISAEEDARRRAAN